MFMAKTKLHSEYFKTMKEAAMASGRRETMDLYKKANSIKKRLHYNPSELYLTKKD